jgi:tRNA(fMet)-specific endonuclease VapC
VKYLLDTNICVFLFRRKSPEALQRLYQTQTGEVGISTVTLAELRDGADKSADPAKNHVVIDAFLTNITLVEFDEGAARCYGAVRSQLESRGTPIGPLDNLIAAQALSLGVTLVTNNVREFVRVTGMAVEDWTQT